MFIVLSYSNPIYILNYTYVFVTTMYLRTDCITNVYYIYSQNQLVPYRTD